MQAHIFDFLFRIENQICVLNYRWVFKYVYWPLFDLYTMLYLTRYTGKAKYLAIHPNYRDCWSFRLYCEIKRMSQAFLIHFYIVAAAFKAIFVSSLWVTLCRAIHMELKDHYQYRIPYLHTMQTSIASLWLEGLFTISLVTRSKV